MNSAVKKRSIVIGGHKTSVSHEDQLWSSLKQIADDRSATLSELVGEIDQSRGERANLSSSIRPFVLGYFRAKAATTAEQIVYLHPHQLAHASTG